MLSEEENLSQLRKLNAWLSLTNNMIFVSLTVASWWEVTQTCLMYNLQSWMLLASERGKLVIFSALISCIHSLQLLNVPYVGLLSAEKYDSFTFFLLPLLLEYVFIHLSRLLSLSAVCVSGWDRWKMAIHSSFVSSLGIQVIFDSDEVKTMKSFGKPGRFFARSAWTVWVGQLSFQGLVYLWGFGPPTPAGLHANGLLLPTASLAKLSDSTIRITGPVLMWLLLPIQ